MANSDTPVPPPSSDDSPAPGGDRHWLTKEEGAALLGVSPPRFIDLVRELGIEFRSEGRTRYYARQSVLEALKGRQEEQERIRERNVERARYMTAVRLSRQAGAPQAPPPAQASPAKNIPPAAMDKLAVYHQIATDLSQLITAVSKA